MNNHTHKMPNFLAEIALSCVDINAINEIAIQGTPNKDIHDSLTQHGKNASDLHYYLTANIDSPVGSPVRKSIFATPFTGSDNNARRFSLYLADLPLWLKTPAEFNFEKDKFKRFYFKPRTMEQAYLMHIIASMNENGKAFILCSPSLLTRLADAQIRKLLLEKNILDTVILLPNKLLEFASIPIAILVLNNNKKDDKVLFIDASKDFEKAKRNNILRPQDIEKIGSCYRNSELIYGYSNKVSIDEIQDNDYSLNVPLYVKPCEQSEIIDLLALEKDILAIDDELAIVKRKLAQNLERLGGGKINR